MRLFVNPLQIGRQTVADFHRDYLRHFITAQFGNSRLQFPEDLGSGLDDKEAFRSAPDFTPPPIE